MTIAKTKVKQLLFAQEEDTLESDEESDHDSDTGLEPLQVDSETPEQSPKSTSTTLTGENATDHSIKPLASAKKKRSLPRISSPAWTMSEHSDEDRDDPRPVTKKRKTDNANAQGTAKESGEALDGEHFDLGLTSAKYDLMTTKPGQITFLFEKVSGSKL